MLNSRKNGLLQSIIKEHIISAQPVGSKFLVEKCGFDLSPATIRNEMAELEREGYIYQPHTSAGRVPTEKAYKMHVENLVPKKMKAGIDLGKAEDPDSSLKKLAKALAELTGETVFIAFSKNDLYYTGLSNLFSKPEFSERDIVLDISEVIDAMDEVLHKLVEEWDEIEGIPKGEGIKVLVGTDNPFMPICSSVVMKYDIRHKEGILGALGSMRMDYERIISIMNNIKC